MFLKVFCSVVHTLDFPAPAGPSKKTECRTSNSSCSCTHCGQKDRERVIVLLLTGGEIIIIIRRNILFMAPHLVRARSAYKDIRIRSFHHTHTHTDTHTHTRTHARTHARTHTHKHTHARARARTHAHTHKRARARARAHTLQMHALLVMGW